MTKEQFIKARKLFDEIEKLEDFVNCAKPDSTFCISTYDNVNNVITIYVNAELSNHIKDIFIIHINDLKKQLEAL